MINKLWEGQSERGGETDKERDRDKEKRQRTEEKAVLKYKEGTFLWRQSAYHFRSPILASQSNIS